ncbi:hypothetical protein M3M38_07285 [Fructilactobacillus cliffordii]|uniref:hypothetical protein n=1 Tax=Fructilactobacillus cliffordii TaxID=2940299 RepID=UPI00209225DC|nr:hypothetical protein [Fructilactobacillus cliffordii]USS86462.1 hypothetical protein M3M38_07285 [Fructilactobacillus cliffordii]
MIEEIITNKILDILHNVETNYTVKRWPEAMNKQELCNYLGGIDAKTLEKRYTCQPDFPTGDETDGVRNRVWHKTQVDEWLARHTKPYKEIMTR